MTDLIRERYEPLEVVGHGGEGRVLKAIDRQHDRLVALKVRTVKDAADRETLLAEARLLLDIPTHPALPVVREDFFDGDSYLMVMDWIEGTDLAKLLRARGRPGLAPSSVLAWLAETASALTHLHTLDRPVVHGDVKPANLILTSGGRVVLVDFGLSSAPDSPRRRGGTIGYAAPELAAGHSPSRATDVYALAATAFALLTGEAPTGVRPSWDGIDPEQAARLESAVRAGLATDPGRRPPTPGEFVEQLRAGWGSTLPTGVLTFCLTDIEGSTALWESHPAGMARALVQHDQLIADTVERHHGRFLKSMGEGDATVSVFAAATDAVDAVIQLQHDLGETPTTDGVRLRVRAALHTGEAEQRGGDYFGTTLNVAARLRGLADGQQVFVSAATAGLVRPSLPSSVSLVDLGVHRLRGLRELEHVYALAAPGVDAPPAATVCPYPGLPAFDVDDTDWFFGRGGVVADVVARLRRDRFVAVVAPSGAGKSSVLRAGVAAAWGDATVLTPGEAPEPLTDGDGLVIVDQFEEVFTLCVDVDRRRAFIDSVVARRGATAVGLRADHYGRCAEHAGLAARLAGGHVLLGPMNDDELRDAIVGPAAAAGLRVEPALVDLLIAEMAGEPGALPLLSHALRATWQQRDGRTLTVEAYRATGGLRAAISTTAEQVYAGLDAGAQQLARRTFLAMTEPGEGIDDSRRRATLAELVPADGPQRLDALLSGMAAARLVSVDEDTVEVAHEALIREWPRLRAWIEEDRDGLRLHRHLTVAANAWVALGREPGELYRGPRLAAAAEWAAGTDDLSAREVEFLAASERSRARGTRRLRAVLTAVAVALVVAVVAAVVAFGAQRRASASRDRADVSRVAAVSRSLVEREPDVGILLAVAANQLDDTADTRSTLLNALETHPLLAGLIYGVDSGLEGAVFTPDGSMLATPTSDGSGTMLWDTNDRRRVATLTHEDDFSLAAAISPDGRWLAVPAIYESDHEVPGGRLEIWDLQTRQLARAIESPAGPLTSAAFNADGTRLFTQAFFDGDLTPHDVVIVWDTASWTPVGAPWRLADEYSDDSALAVSPDGTLAAMPLSGATAVGVWRVADRTAVGQPTDVGELSGGQQGMVTALAFSPDDTTLAIGSELGQVYLVDPATGRPIAAPLELPESAATSIEFSPDGSVVAIGRVDGRTQLYDVATHEPQGPPLAASSSAINRVTFSADGSMLATAGADRTGAIWRLDGGRSIGEAMTGQDAAVTEAAITADALHVVTAALDGTVVVRQAGTDEIVATIALPGEALTVAAAPAGPRLAAGGNGGTVSLFDVDGGRRVDVPVGKPWVHQVAFAPDGQAVAVAMDTSGNDPFAFGPGAGEVLFLDPNTGVQLGTPITLDEPAIGVAYSPDGRTLAVIAINNVLHVYRVDSGAEIGPPIESADALIGAVAFSPGGTRMAVGLGSGTVQQYDVSSHQQVGDTLTSDGVAILGIAYSPDGRVLAAVTAGLSTTRLWDAVTGVPIGGRLTGGNVPYTFRTFVIDHIMGARPAFFPDGSRLVTPGFPGATVMWDLEPSHWAAAACAVVGRDLTDDEWDRYLPGRAHRTVCPAD